MLTKLSDTHYHHQEPVLILTMPVFLSKFLLNIKSDRIKRYTVNYCVMQNFKVQARTDDVRAILFES